MFHIKSTDWYYCPFLPGFIQGAKARFLKWLETHTDQKGLLTLFKPSLKMVSCSELQDGSVMCEGPLLLVTDFSWSESWPQFSMETYRKNLQTKLLGHTVLYAEVVTSTMDLLEG